MSLWRWILWILTWLSSDELVFDEAAARASAAVTVARASLVVEAPPAPKPEPTPDGKPRRTP